MSVTETAVRNRAVTYFTAVVLMAAGFASFFQLGQLEDPDFTIKTAKVTTLYPGASAEEVELEVTDRIELELQQLKQLDNIESLSMPGVSIVTVNIKPSFTSDTIPQVFDELRRKVDDVQSDLPPSVVASSINDEFGDVYGHVIALVGDGYSYAELEEYAKQLKRELSLTEGVAKVDFWGTQEEVVFLEVSESRLSQMGISENTFEQTLANQNAIVDAGNIDMQDRRIRIAPTGDFDSVEDIASLTITPSATDRASRSGASELVRIRDLADVRRSYEDPPSTLLRFNGRPAIALSISNIPGVNVVNMGERIDARLKELTPTLPVGIEVDRVHWQSDVISDSVNGFLESFAQAVAIVILVITVGMGWRLAIVIGLALIGTILGSFLLMNLFGIDLQRMSLGALIIALGMMVDNAIVVADGFSVRLKQGAERTQAAIESASVPSMPLLGSTLVAVMAFYPIAASDENAGEYCASLFSVVAISLLMSWLISVTLTPLQCMDMLPDPDPEETGGESFSSPLYRRFQGIVEGAVRFRFLTVTAMVALLVAAMLAFTGVKQLFFPDSSMSKFMIDVWQVQGTRVEKTSGDIALIEERLLGDERVANVSAFIGAGPPRFYLPVEPEGQSSAYGQVIVNVHNPKDIDALIDELTPWLSETLPDALVPVRKYGVGPSDSWKFELRISGPAVADPQVLRGLADEVLGILRTSPLAGVMQTDWRQRTPALAPLYSELQGRTTGVTRENLADATKRAYDGRQVGTYREADKLIPIKLRSVEAERAQVGNLGALQLQPDNTTDSLPLAQVTEGILTVWEDPIIGRRDRRRTITVQANPVAGVTLPSLRQSVAAEIAVLDLPPGYRMEWGGETESTEDSQASLIPGVVPAVIVMALIVVALFNAYRPPLIILCALPFIVIGISFGLLLSGAAFGFVALLGAMSLVGMMIKNSIVLLDQVDIYLEQGLERYDALIMATLSRLSPVVLTAATTVLGVIPLLADGFWTGLAVTIMGGLSFATVVTMVFVPVLYATFYRLDGAPVGPVEDTPQADIGAVAESG
ncbi:MAG: efflux RND transporter permease subunit [Pseudomonadota bacterium]